MTTPRIPSVPVRWNVHCIVMQPDSRGSQDVPMADVQSALQRSIDAWTVETSRCNGLTLSMTAPKGILEVGDDGHQALIFRNVTWQRPGHPPYDPSAIALTTVMYVDTPGQLGDGTLTDADIEVNNVDYTFTVDPNSSTARDGTVLVNLINTLTHELGHVQGLAHTCWDHLTATPPLDNTGTPIPDCNDPDLPASIVGDDHVSVLRARRSVGAAAHPRRRQRRLRRLRAAGGQARLLSRDRQRRRRRLLDFARARARRAGRARPLAAGGGAGGAGAVGGARLQNGRTITRMTMANSTSVGASLK